MSNRAGTGNAAESAVRSAGQPALAVQNLSKTFPGARALDQVTFTLERAQVHSLIGGNGSGKSTLVKCLAGIQPADPGGEVSAAGERIAADRISPGWARANGLRFVHQNPGMFPTLTVQENFALGHGFPTSGGKIRWRKLARRTESLLERFKIAAKPDQILGLLRPADRAMIAIARAMQDLYEDESAGDPVGTLILDEPTASLPEEEVQIILDAIRGYAQNGLTIVFVSHRLEEVLAISDTVTVLRDGELVTSRPAQGLTEQNLAEFIIGDAIAQLKRVGPARSIGDVVARLDKVTAGPLRDVSLHVRAGEILGLAGLLGSGRTETLQVLFGVLKAESGRVILDGKERAFSSPSEAMRNGVALSPEDRTEAMFPNMTVRENFTAPSMRRYSHFFINQLREKLDTGTALASFKVKSAGLEIPISTLSGGNQQKVMLARWVYRSPRLLLLDEPTQGVDVGARADAYAIIRDAAASGMAVIVVSSDFEELADLCDRVMVLTAGRVTAELANAEVSRHKLTESVLLGKSQTLQ